MSIFLSFLLFIWIQMDPWESGFGFSLHIRWAEICVISGYLTITVGPFLVLMLIMFQASFVTELEISAYVPRGTPYPNFFVFLKKIQNHGWKVKTFPPFQKPNLPQNFKIPQSSSLHLHWSPPPTGPTDRSAAHEHRLSPPTADQ
jgi:hypothetical protein